METSLSLFIADSILASISEPCLALVILGGLCSKYRRDIGVASVLLFSSMLLNYWLKGLWQMPLPPSLGKKGWAFPSGHMQAAVVFWGWLGLSLLRRAKKTQASLLALLFAYGWALVRRGYHYPVDVLGAWAVGLMILALTQSLLGTSIFKRWPWLFPLAGFLLGEALFLLIAFGGASNPRPHLFFARAALLLLFLGSLAMHWWQRRRSEELVTVNAPLKP